MEVHDWLLGEDLDLAIQDGDFVYGESTEEHQRDLLLATKGSFRQSPTIGVGVSQMLLDNASNESLTRLIQQEMERDGMTVDHLTVTSLGTVEMTATYD